jgi:hypothetical protein
LIPAHSGFSAALSWALPNCRLSLPPGPPTTSRAQPQLTAAQLATLTPLDPTNVPRQGTFWYLYGPYPDHPYPPLPCPPTDMPEASIYALDDSHFLVDDAEVDYAALTQQREMDAALRSLEGEGGDSNPPPMDPSSAYPSNSLWLSISEPTNGLAHLVIHGTVPDVPYEIFSKQTLTDAVWLSEGPVPGAADQDWTPTTVPVGDRTNSLFLWCRSWIDSEGNGLPDWWEQYYFTTNGVDPYALCPSGDGWTILQAYQNGWDPNLFYTPPPPTGLTVRFNGSTNSLSIGWNPSPGPVTNSIVQRHIPALRQTNYFSFAGTTGFTDSLPAGALPQGSAPPDHTAPTYWVMAEYTGGPSPWSPQVAA